MWLLDDCQVAAWLRSHSQLRCINHLKKLHRLIIFSPIPDIEINSINLLPTKYYVYQYTWSCTRQRIMYIPDNNVNNNNVNNNNNLHKIIFNCYEYMMGYQRLRPGEIRLHFTWDFNEYYEEEDNFVHFYKNGNLILEGEWRNKYYEYYRKWHHNEKVVKSRLSVVNIDININTDNNVNSSSSSGVWFQFYQNDQSHGWHIHRSNNNCSRFVNLYYHGVKIINSYITLYLGLYLLTREEYIVCHHDQINRFLKFFDRLPPEVMEIVLGKLTGTDQIRINYFFTSCGIKLLWSIFI